MTKKLYFRYKSIANLARLMVTIRFESNNPPRDVTVYHQRFDNEPDDIYQTFLETLFPEGGTIGEQQIDALMNYIRHFMETDEKSLDLYVDYDKRQFRSYVYFKPDRKVIHAPFGDHNKIVTDICYDYFKDFDEKSLTSEYLRRFVLENFEIKSDNSTIESVANGIANDSNYLIREIIMHHRDIL